MADSIDDRTEDDTPATFPATMAALNPTRPTPPAANRIEAGFASRS